MDPFEFDEIEKMARCIETLGMLLATTDYEDELAGRHVATAGEMLTEQAAAIQGALARIRETIKEENKK